MCSQSVVDRPLLYGFALVYFAGENHLKRTAFTLALLVLAGCGRAPNVYVVGAAGPWKESYGIMTRRGIDLAVEEINHAGGIRGTPLRVVERDDEANGTR